VIHTASAWLLTQLGRANAAMEIATAAGAESGENGENGRGRMQMSLRWVETQATTYVEVVQVAVSRCGAVWVRALIALKAEITHPYSRPSVEYSE
jgi:hypothetical protein